MNVTCKNCLFLSDSYPPSMAIFKIKNAENKIRVTYPPFVRYLDPLCGFWYFEGRRVLRGGGQLNFIKVHVFWVDFPKIWGANRL